MNIIIIIAMLLLLLFTSVVAAIDPDTSIQNINRDWLGVPFNVSEVVGGDNIKVTSFSFGISSGIKSTSFSKPQYSQTQICKQINHIVNNLQYNLVNRTRLIEFRLICTLFRSPQSLLILGDTC